MLLLYQVFVEFNIDRFSIRFFSVFDDAAVWNQHVFFIFLCNKWVFLKIRGSSLAQCLIWGSIEHRLINIGDELIDRIFILLLLLICFGILDILLFILISVDLFFWEIRLIGLNGLLNFGIFNFVHDLIWCVFLSDLRVWLDGLLGSLRIFHLFGRI